MAIVNQTSHYDLFQSTCFGCIEVERDPSAISRWVAVAEGEHTPRFCGLFVRLSEITMLKRKGETMNESVIECLHRRTACGMESPNETYIPGHPGRGADHVLGVRYHGHREYVTIGRAAELSSHLPHPGASGQVTTVGLGFRGGSAQ